MDLTHALWGLLLKPGQKQHWPQITLSTQFHKYRSITLMGLICLRYDVNN